MAFDYGTVDLEAILKRCYDQMDEMQRPGVAKAKKSGRVIFDMWMGTGKTFTGLVSGLCFKPQRWLIICGKNAAAAFRNDIQKFLPEFDQPQNFSHVKGTALERQRAYKTSALFFITTSAAFLRDLDYLVANDIAFDVVTIDEADKAGLRNHKSKTFKSLKELINTKHYLKHKKRIEKLGKFLAPNKVSLVNILTGTLTSKGVPQLFGYLHLMDPKLFSSYWKFVETFTFVINGPFGKVLSSPRNTEGLAQCTYPYIHRVSEKDASEFLPDLRRIKLPFEMSPKIRSLYDQMAEELFFMIPDAIESDNSLQYVNSTLAQFMKLRQLITCPAIIDPSLGHGDAIEACIEKMLELSEMPNFTHNVIFTPFTKAIPIFKDYCASALKLDPDLIYTMQGGMETEDVQHIETLYRKNPKSLVICSTMYAASFNLETGLNAYHPHFSWNQDDNKQAEARIRRKTSDRKHTVMSYYAYPEDTIAGTIFDILNSNTRINNITYQDFSRIKSQLMVKL